METGQNADIIFSIVVATLALLVFAVAIVVFFIVYRKRLLEKKLQLERKESEHRLELLKTTIETTELERKRIAGDLHDEIGSHLSTIRMALNAIKATAKGDEKVVELANESKAIIDDTIESVRNISHNILPPGLEKFGLLNTASDLCQKISQHSKVKILFKSEISECLTPQQELAVYRILQELLNNSIRHAEPACISIEIKEENKNIIINYIDDGKGFNRENNSIHSGLGLKNIESRSMALMGSLYINSTQGKGFEAEIKFPININLSDK